jgi:hypothetical protein
MNYKRSAVLASARPAQHDLDRQHDPVSGLRQFSARDALK